MVSVYRVTVIIEIPGKRGELSHDADHAGTERSYMFSGAFGETLDRAEKAFKSEAVRPAQGTLTVRLEELTAWPRVSGQWAVIKEVHL